MDAEQEASEPQTSKAGLAVILTSPHALCDNGAAALERAFEEALDGARISYQALTSGLVPRPICDLNRADCATTEYLTRYREALDGAIAFGGRGPEGVVVVDAHSYPDDYDWGLGSIPQVGVVLRPAGDRYGTRPLDVAIMDRMLALAGPGWAAVRRVRPEHRRASSVAEVDTFISRGKQIFFALLQGTTENYIMTQAESKGVSGLLVEVNVAAASQPDLLQSFVRALTSAIVSVYPDLRV